jgi:ketol-acid reductoisomerase
MPLAGQKLLQFAHSLNVVEAHFNPSADRNLIVADLVIPTQEGSGATA